MFVVAIILIGIVAAAVGIVVVREYERQLSDERGASAADMCASLFTMLYEQEGTFDPESESYKEYRNFLRDICEESEMDYLYAFECDVENSRITYIMCVADNEEADAQMVRERGYGTVVNAEISDLEKRALQGEKVSQALEVDSEFAHTLAWFSRVDGVPGNVLAAAEYSVTEQRRRIATTVAFALLPAVLVLVVLLIVELAVLDRNVFKPIGFVAKRMREFSAKRAGGFEPLGISSHDEIGEIAEAFEGMGADIDVYLRDIERMTSERVQSQVELDVARRIQLGIVPESFDLSGTGFEVHALSRPARQVGGDFYDCLETDDGRVAVVVGDVSGKGIAAAMFMTLVKTAVRDGLLAGRSPAVVLNNANECLCASNPEGMFVTIFAAVLNPCTGELRYANAGHVPPYLASADGARVLEVDPGVLLGLFDDADVQEGSISLEQGDCLILVTDGATEAVNADRSFLGEEALVRSLAAGVPYARATSAADAVADAVDAFAVGCEQFDDLTVLALRWISRCETRKLAVSMASLAVVRKKILAAAVDPAFGRKACLACEEAFVNIVSYSDARSIWYSVEAETQVEAGAEAEAGTGSADGAGESGRAKARPVSLRVVLEDDGTPFDPFAVTPEQKSFEDLDGGGMGIGLIRSIAHEATYRRVGSHNVLTLVFE